MPAVPTPAPAPMDHPEKTSHDGHARVKSAPHPAAHEHSLLHGGHPFYTALSLVFFVLFFYQPHAWRVRVWTSVRGLVDDERTFYLAYLVCVHSFVCVGANLVMGAIYYADPAGLARWKVQHQPWPWQRGPEERTAYFALIRKSLALIVFNQYLLAPILVWHGYAQAKRMGSGGDVDQVPHWYQSLAQIAVFMVIEDTLFYWAHRTLHHPLLYGRIHKVHHAYRRSIGLASEYAHPVEFVCANMVPFSAGPLLLGAHYWTIGMWTLLRIGETVDGHCGYEWPWSPYRLLPFSGSSTAHDFHHSHNVGNFGSFFTWWDAACGTDRAFRKHEAKILQAALMEADAEHQREDHAAVDGEGVTKPKQTIISPMPMATVSSSSSEVDSDRAASPRPSIEFEGDPTPEKVTAAADHAAAAADADSESEEQSTSTSTSKVRHRISNS